MRRMDDKKRRAKLWKNFEQISVRAHETPANARRLARRVTWSGDPFAAELAQREHARDGELRHSQNNRRHKGPKITCHDIPLR